VIDIPSGNVIEKSCKLSHLHSPFFNFITIFSPFAKNDITKIVLVPKISSFHTEVVLYKKFPSKGESDNTMMNEGK